MCVGGYHVLRLFRGFGEIEKSREANEAFIFGFFVVGVWLCSVVLRVVGRCCQSRGIWIRDGVSVE